MDEIERIRNLYSTQYRPDPYDRSYTWHPRNNISIYYRQAQERAIIKLLNDFNLAIESFRSLDVGCGGGLFLRFLASLGAPPGNLAGIDLMPNRIEDARTVSPVQVDFQVGNAEHLPFPNSSFDLVSQFTMLSSILDNDVRMNVAKEMVRVLKSEGYILSYDFREDGPNSHGMDKNEIIRHFPGCRNIAIHPLHPPYASRLARRSIFLCELWDHIPGIGRTHDLILLQKVG